MPGSPLRQTKSPAAWWTCLNRCCCVTRTCTTLGLKKISHVQSTTTLDKCCTTTSPGRPRQRCPATTTVCRLHQIRRPFHKLVLRQMVNRSTLSTLLEVDPKLCTLY